ncbi:MAG: imidazole glycerol phosphate synthase subunit HisH [Actinobacteria bacterium]|nr:imidazole glycerol phosphate synthase subunit HisH [Actinomycetota bacterium]NCX17593.1 imidazole glycerol phosphate synthase subunit HisH [Acidimicrobiia bacterium]NCZ56035.1 imidazole glycerol phosphate synthase subunit HisH [Acidimicrobiia bacterium]NCZ67526.1 imidazole glycerol phosphate synthase subunit HisH [Acidimicrobiia bacterium]NCZ86826.1 imidazole glycerol phosphate synthase subunit HisH [Actinomycetota bacterium]
MTAPLIAVLDYGIGNLRSAQKALQKVGADARLTNDAGLVRDAHAVVLPGVGAFGACMTALRESGLESLVHERIDGGKPFLGICVGMQMLFDDSEENPGAKGLGVISGTVRYLPDAVKRPQMQWNHVHITRLDPMFANLPAEPWMYFVHSLHPVPLDDSCIVATTDYGCAVTAAVRIDNVFAVQFHPEKSAVDGLALLGNFVDAARLVAA